MSRQSKTIPPKNRKKCRKQIHRLENSLLANRELFDGAYDAPRDLQ